MATRLESARELASRLRQLRLSHWPRSQVTQEQLANAFGVSVPLISSWERMKSPTTPPEDRLHSYALFFATERSVGSGRPRLFGSDELTEAEVAQYHRLAAELCELRSSSLGLALSPAADMRTDAVGTGFWCFSDSAPITIICGQLPAELRADEAYTSPESPDYVALYSYADLDSLIELHGHLRAANPESPITVGLAKAATRDQLTTHLVVLGGVDWNPINVEILEALKVPVKQKRRLDDPDVGAFEVAGGTLVLEPELRREGDREYLIEDVAHFVRGPNPYNRRRTVTICNGQFARGVYGAVRSLTDIRFRARNTDYVRSRFNPAAAFSILARVSVVRGEVITPDWTQNGTVLHEWSELGG